MIRPLFSLSLSFSLGNVSIIFNYFQLFSRIFKNFQELWRTRKIFLYIYLYMNHFLFSGIESFFNEFGCAHVCVCGAFSPFSSSLKRISFHISHLACAYGVSVLLYRHFPSQFDFIWFHLICLFVCLFVGWFVWVISWNFAVQMAKSGRNFKSIGVDSWSSHRAPPLSTRAAWFPPAN